MGMGGGQVVATYTLILDFKAKFFKRSHCNIGINSVWGTNNMVIFYKFGNTEEKA